jgi:hypothetical protein
MHLWRHAQVIEKYRYNFRKEPPSYAGRVHGKDLKSLGKEAPCEYAEMPDVS